MKDYGHFIGGKRVAGTSERFGDVFEPMTGEVAGRVALASRADVRAAVENARDAQPGWAAVNPQRRARVFMKFLELIHRNMDELADLLAREHGKTIPDARGDIQRGYEVVEFACGVPHLLKGEFTDGAGPGIDAYSMRQPLGVTAGITPFNFPAMIPMWKFAPAIACGNAFVLKPSERDPGCADAACRTDDRGGSAGRHPQRREWRQSRGGRAAGRSRHARPSGSWARPPLPSTFIRARSAAKGKRVHAFGGAKNHMVIMPDADMEKTVDALIGAGYGSAGERCMAISVAVPVGKGTADRLMEQLDPPGRGAQDRAFDRRQAADYGPLVTQRRRQQGAGLYRHRHPGGCRRSRSTDAASRCRATRRASISAAALFDNVTKDMRIYKEEIFGPVLSVVRANTYEESSRPLQRS